MLRFCEWLARILPVTEQGHLLHADDSLYMGRWEFFRTRLFWPRLHHIATPDLDRHLHDHPADFFSLVLTGGYIEDRPATVDPCFEEDGAERTVQIVRGPGSFAIRHATDRHKISFVAQNTYTLFIFFGGKRHWWGFYTPAGKVFWKDYPSCHDAGQVIKAAIPSHGNVCTDGNGRVSVPVRDIINSPKVQRQVEAVRKGLGRA